MKVLVEYDGTLQAKEALKYGVEKVKEKGGEVVAFQVFNSSMFVDYDVFGAEDEGRAEALRFAEEAKVQQAVCHPQASPGSLSHNNLRALDRCEGQHDCSPSQTQMHVSNRAARIGSRRDPIRMLPSDRRVPRPCRDVGLFLLSMQIPASDGVPAKADPTTLPLH